MEAQQHSATHPEKENHIDTAWTYFFDSCFCFLTNIMCRSAVSDNTQHSATHPGKENHTDTAWTYFFDSCFCVLTNIMCSSAQFQIIYAADFFCLSCFLLLLSLFLFMCGSCCCCYVVVVVWLFCYCFSHGYWFPHIQKSIAKVAMSVWRKNQHLVNLVKFEVERFKQ